MGGKPIKVLLIENNPKDAARLRKLLAPPRQFRLTARRSLGKGLAILQNKPFDIVLLDLSLPDSQGVDTFDKVHAQAPETPVVILLGPKQDRTEALAALRGGAQDYLIKGKTGRDLLQRIISDAIERQSVYLKLERYAKELLHSDLQLRSIIEKNADGIIIGTCQ